MLSSAKPSAPGSVGDPGVSWLLASSQPAVRYLARRDLLGEDARDDAAQVLTGAKVHLVDWQWPDGGWNCDRRVSGRRSSFHESLLPTWGLTEYARATRAQWARDAAQRTAELLLQHRIYRSLHDGHVINQRWLEPRYPPYWHYDVLQALVILERMGLAGDTRAAEAVEHVAALRDPDGTWRPRGYWWSPPGAARSPEAVDWGRGGPSEMLTLNALRVLKAAG